MLEIFHIKQPYSEFMFLINALQMLNSLFLILLTELKLLNPCISFSVLEYVRQITYIL